MSEPRHAPPFYCPYCSEEDIRPHGEDAGEWRCELCRRVWRLRYVGVVAPDLDRAGVPAAPGGSAGTADSADPAAPTGSAGSADSTNSLDSVDPVDPVDRGRVAR